MSLKMTLRAVALAACVALPGVAQAGVLKAIGGGLAAGAAEKLAPVLSATVADVDRRATRNEDHIATLATGLLYKGNVVAEERLDQVDRILEARVLQVQTAASDVVDEGLGRVDTLVQNRLNQADLIAKGLVKQLDGVARDRLDQANDILRARVSDLGREVDGALGKADTVLAARIDQVDEVAGRRLGNVDVIASKQRIGLEVTAVRLAVLIGLVVFVVFVLLRLWDGYKDAVSLAAAENKRSAARTWVFVKRMGAPLLGQLAVVGAAAGALFLLYRQLPMGAQREAAELTALHEKGLETSLARFDFTRARFHASQLEYLSPKDASRYQAMAAKAELLRDLFARPTLWATEGGIASISERKAAVQRILGRTADPDLLTVDAMILWQTGSSRAQEHEAASLCARALRLRPQGFPLAPVARAYIETFLKFPYIDAATGLGRDAETLGDLEAVLDAAAASDESTHPLAVQLELVRLMGDVEASSAAAYVAAIQKHAEVSELLRRHAPAAELTEARRVRTVEAKKVLAAWQKFDDALVERPALRDNAAVLSVFRLDDALYVRAKWFADHPDTDSLAPLLVAGKKALEKKPQGKLDVVEEPFPQPSCTARAAASPVDVKERLRLAPPRIVWARRYRALLDGPARTLLGLQEAARFDHNERAALELECDLSAAPSAADKRSAARAAASLGLYVDDPSGRVAFGRQLAPSPDDKAVEDALRERTMLLL
jgi:hypothetical protein